MGAAVGTVRVRAIEWPTVALVAVIYLSWFGLTWCHDAMPVWLWLILAGWLGAWWGSCQHELLHGHPTPSAMVNTALATPPLTLWLPFERYRQTHLIHHRDDRLTDPLDDPESRYWTAEDWQRLGPAGRALVGAQATLLGRLTIGPVWSILVFWRDEMAAIRRGEPGLARIWLWHALFAAAVLVWAIVVCGVPLWQYGLGFVYLGTALSLIRSFAEHRASDCVAHRTAIVEGSPILGLLFLYNNFHVVHHGAPGLPWYRIQAAYRGDRARFLAANGGLVYAGYRDVFARFLLRPHDRPLHPSGRAAPQAGTL